MLTITNDAADVIRTLVRENEAADLGGLRISLVPAGAQAGLMVELADRAEAGDEVVATDGARVFIAPLLVEPLCAKVLDAEVDGKQITFSLEDAQAA
jgi:Fe-S cluster assembly iron-binding protein IscA